MNSRQRFKTRQNYPKALERNEKQAKTRCLCMSKFEITEGRVRELENTSIESIHYEEQK